MAIIPLSTFYSATYTFTDDTAHRVEENADIELTSCNICCYDNDAYIGNQKELNGIIRTNAIVWFDTLCRPFDFMFKNLTAGSNAKIVIYGTLKKK